MATLYLFLNAALYGGLALWCTFQVETTSRFLGFLTLSNSGRSEYLTIYGGLQWGLALMFLLFALKPDLQRTGLLVSMLFYAPLVLHRLISLARFSPVERGTLVVAGLEIALLLAAVLLYWMASRGRA